MFGIESSNSRKQWARAIAMNAVAHDPDTVALALLNLQDERNASDVPLIVELSNSLLDRGIDSSFDGRIY